MPKLRAPLFSLAASGHLGPNLVYRPTSTGPGVRAAGPRTASPSALQTAQRARFTATSALYQQDRPNAQDKLAWTHLAAIMGVNNSNWTAYLSNQLIERKLGQSPQNYRCTIWNDFAATGNLRLVRQGTQSPFLEARCSAKPGGPVGAVVNMTRSSNNYNVTIPAVTIADYPYIEVWRRAFSPAYRVYGLLWASDRAHV